MTTLTKTLTAFGACGLLLACPASRAGDRFEEGSPRTSYQRFLETVTEKGFDVASELQLRYDPPVRSGDNMRISFHCQKVHAEYTFTFDWYSGNKGVYHAEMYGKRDKRMTGVKKEVPYACLPGIDASAAHISLTGQQDDGTQIDPAVQETLEVNGDLKGTYTVYFLVPLKAMLQKLARKPAAAAFLVTLPKALDVDANEVAVDGELISAMNLNTEQWLPPEILTDILMTRITSAIKTREYYKALPSFKQLDQMDKNLPESFYYYYIEALASSGKSQDARVRIDAYLQKYGKKGKYYPQVLEVTSKL